MIGTGFRLGLIRGSQSALLQRQARLSINILSKLDSHLSIRSCIHTTSRWPKIQPLQNSLPISKQSLIRTYATHREANPEYLRLNEAWRQGEAQMQKPQEDWRVPESEAKTPNIIKPILFFLAIGTATYSWAAWKTVKDTKEKADEILDKTSVFGDFTSFISSSLSPDILVGDISGRVSEAQLRSAKKHELAVRLGWQMQWLTGWCDQLHLPQGAKEFVGSTYLSAATWYLNLPDYQAVTIPVLATTAAVFLGINLTRTGILGSKAFTIARQNFMHSSAANRTRTLLTSVFSHVSLIHLGLNSFALYNFGAEGLMAAPFYHDSDGRRLHTVESTSFYHFLAFFITAGTFASLSTHVFHRVLLSRARSLFGKEIAKKITGRLPGLGASGAIYGLVALSCLSASDNLRFSILGLPFTALPAKEFFGIMASVETGFLVLSLIRGRFIGIFDHAAHMGGALFGYLYFLYGNEFWEKCKRYVRQQNMIMEQNIKSNEHPKTSLSINRSAHQVAPSRIV